MAEPIIPTPEELQRLWVDHQTKAAAPFGDHRKAAAHNQARIGFQLWLQQTKDDAAGVRPAAFRIVPDEQDPDVVHVTNREGRTRRIHREDADPEMRFTSYRLAAGWFGNLPSSLKGTP